MRDQRKRLLMRAMGTLLPLFAVALCAYLIVSCAPGILYQHTAVTATTEEVPHDPLAFVGRLQETLPAGENTGDFAQQLLSWMENNHPPEPEQPVLWTFEQLFFQVTLSYFLCFLALFISGFIVFLLFQFLVLPADPRWKTALLIGLLCASGLPAALIAWWPLTPLSKLLEPVLSLFVDSAAGDTRGLVAFLRAELTILTAMVIGDGLAGMLMLRARTLTSDTHFEAQVATYWSSLRWKHYLLPLPGTLSAVIGREMARRVFPAWSGLLGRFLVTEITLELMLYLLTPLKPQGIGFCILQLTVNGAPPAAFALAASLLMLPLILLRPARAGDE